MNTDKLDDHQISIHNRRPDRPKTRGLDPVTRRARLLAARTYAVRTIPRTAILSGLWDGGQVLAKFGMPLRLPKGTPSNPCEALVKKEDDGG